MIQRPTIREKCAWVRSNTWQDERPVATGLDRFFWFFDFSTNVATGNWKNSEFVQPQPVVQSFAVGFSPISVFFPVQWTGPANTMYIYTPYHHASKDRWIPWWNVDCLSWIKLTTVHNQWYSIFQLIWGEFELITWHRKIVIAIDKILGIFDHSDTYMEQVKMDRNHQISLNPELWNVAKKHPDFPSLLRMYCMGRKKWLGLFGDKHSQYWLTTYDTLLLYHSTSHEHGIH